MFVRAHANPGQLLATMRDGHKPILPRDDHRGLPASISGEIDSPRPFAGRKGIELVQNALTKRFDVYTRGDWSGNRSTDLGLVRIHMFVWTTDVR